MKTVNKVHLVVMDDQYNNWYKHQNRLSNGHNTYGYKLQLKGDTRIGPVFLQQVAEQVGLPNFMQDFTKILKYSAENKVSLFTLYISKNENE